LNLALADGFELVRADGEPDAPFQAGSVSKPVAAFVALRLVNSGLLELDQDVNERLVSWQLPDGAGVTLRRLLTHTAGLGVPFCPGYEPGAALPTLVQVLDGRPPAVTEPVRVEAPPAGTFRYSGGGYALLQLLLEDVTATRFADLAHALAFEPLGMTNSTFEQRTGPWHRYPEQAAAGLWTTATDLTRFVGALQRDAAPMWASQVKLPPEGEWSVLADLGMRPPDCFGLGLFLLDGWFGHLGGAHGFFSAFFGSTEGGRALVAWVLGAATPEFFATVLAVADEHGWKGLRT
jgi:CubicO group peptidase (beta-lactamase class C family)